MNAPRRGVRPASSFNQWDELGGGALSLFFFLLTSQAGLNLSTLVAPLISKAWTLSRGFVSPLLSGVLACSLLLSVHGFYSASDDVVQLTPSNFNKEVIQSDSLWLVEFYAPWWVSARQPCYAPEPWGRVTINTLPIEIVLWFCLLELVSGAQCR